MKSHLTLLVLLILISPVLVNAQFRRATCEVQPLWLIPGGVRSSSIGLMGTFDSNGGGTSIHSFKLENTNLIATVGIDFDFDYSRYKAHRIRLAITVSDTDQKEIFESVDASEARTTYRKGWNLSVTKNVNFDNRVYMFTLRCWDTAAFAGRKPFI
jgi:hypothetical protein